MATSEYQKPPFAKFNLHLHIYSSNIFSYSNIEIVYPLPLWILLTSENMNFVLDFQKCWEKRKPNQDMFCNSQKYLYLSKALISGCSRVIPLRFHSRKFNNWEKLAICQSAVIDVNYFFPQTQTPVIILDLGHFFNKQRPTYDWDLRNIGQTKTTQRGKIIWCILWKNA